MLQTVKTQEMSKFETQLFNLLKGEVEYRINSDPQFERKLISCEFTKSDETRYGLEYEWVRTKPGREPVKMFMQVQYFNGMLVIHDLPMRPAALIELGKLFAKHG